MGGSFGRDEGALAGDAEPNAAAFDPGVREAGTDDVMFAVIDAGLAVDAGGNGGAAVDLNGEAFVIDVIGLLLRVDDPLHVLGLVHERAIVVRVDERIRQQRGDFLDLLAGFGLIPGTLELLDLNLVAGRGIVLRQMARRKRGARRGLRARKISWCDSFSRRKLRNVSKNARALSGWVFGV